MNKVRIGKTLTLSLMALSVFAAMAAGPASTSKQVVLGDIVATRSLPVVPSEEMTWDRLFGGNLADLSSNGHEVLYSYEPDAAVLPWEMRIASLVTGEVLVRSVLPLETYPHVGHAAFSPDGTWIAAATVADDGIPAHKPIMPFVVRRDGSGLRWLRNDPYDYNGPSWSPDGRQLAFSRTRGEPVHPEEAGSEHRLVKQAAVILEVTTGNVLSVYDGLAGPRFSPDGRRLLALQNACLVSVDLATGTRTVVWDPKQSVPPGNPSWQLASYAWVSDSMRVLFTAGYRAGEPPAKRRLVWEVHEANVQEGKVQKVATGWLAAASANGKWFLLDYRTGYEQDRARRAAGQPRLQSGDIALFSVVRAGP